jgi:transcription elongation factor GreA
VKKIIFTKIGLENLMKKNEKLVGERPAAVLDLKKAREMGDLSENGYYKAARAKLNDIDREVRHNNYLIKSAVVKPLSSVFVVDVGLRVSIEVDGEERIYNLVGEYEANPKEGKISQLSPVGRALIGKKVNDQFALQLADKTRVYKIKKIELV